MPKYKTADIRNIALVGHTGAGKTSLAEAILHKAGVTPRLGSVPDGTSFLDYTEDAKERGCSIDSAGCFINVDGTQINIMDTPAHADLAGVVSRAVRIAEGVILLVDACEGPLPQIRYVLRKALEAGLAPLVVINKIDRPEARPVAVLNEIRDLMVDLDASTRQREFPVLYCNARKGLCRRELDEPDRPLMPLFEEILRCVPAPRFDPESAMQFLVTSLDYDDYLGRLASGRVFNGELQRGQPAAHCRLDGTTRTCRVTGLFGFDGFRRVEIDRALPGDLVSLTGVEAVQIGESLSDVERPAPLPQIKVDEPTLAVVLSVNDSPTADIEAARTEGRELRERLWKEILTNPSIRVEETDSPDAFRLSARGELQLVILIEMLRREGYEMLVSRPEVLTRSSGEDIEEPMELLVVDCPENFISVVTEKASGRRGRLTKMVNHGAGRVRMEFRIPSRGLIGFRTEFLSDTRGSGILHHVFDGYDAWQGEIAGRTTGSLVAEFPGQATASAIGHLQPRGTIFVGPGDGVYTGMVVGENSRPNDLVVDITKSTRSTTPNGPTDDPTARLLPPRSMSLEQALEFLGPDEVAEVTPRALRMRKKLLRIVPQA